MPGLGLGKPIHDIVRRDRAHIRDSGQFFSRGLHQSIQTAKGSCQHFTCLGTHLPDAQGINQPAHILLLTGFDRLEQLFRSLAAGLPEGFYILQGQVVNICRGFDQALLDQRIHDGGTETFNIHGIPADKMGNIPAELGRTFRTGTPQKRSIGIPFHPGAADRTGIRQEIRLGIFRPFLLDHIQNFGDDLAGLADVDRIADANIPLSDKVLIMQGGIGDGGACQTDRTHHSLGSQDTGPAHLDDNVFHHGFLDFRGIFVGHGPAGEFGGGTHSLALGKVIDLDHSSVDVTGQFLPVFVDGEYIIVNFPDTLELLIGNHLEFQLLQVIQSFGMGGKLHSFCQLDVENQNIQSPLGGNLRVQLPQRTGGGISGVCEEGLPLLFLPGVELFETLLGHIHLTPDDQPGRGIFQGHGDGTDGFQILCHILTHIAVATGGTPEKLAVDILQRHGKSVDLRFHGELRRGFRRQGFLQEFIQFLQRKHILQAHQRHGMGVFFKGAYGGTAYPLGGRIGLQQFRVGLFQILQFPKEPVIFKIRHLGIIQHIIAVICFGQDGS